MEPTADLFAALLPERLRSDDRAHAALMILADLAVALRVHHLLKSDQAGEPE